MSIDTQDQLLPVLEDAPREGTGPILYENESLDQLLSTLPKTLGLMKSQLTYTCFDVSKDYFAAGTNLGLVCMYSFQSQNMQFIQNRSDPITYVLIDSYRKWVALGDKQGAVSLFNFNKEMLFATQEKSHSSVTCLAWGKESDILFSGYSSGKIIVSNFQSDKNSLYSKVLVETGPAIFQLGYQIGVLLVSSQQRSFLLRLGADLLPVGTVSIGSKDRKPGMYGATFFQDENNETKIAVARPGFRIWFVSMDGLVESTGKLKDHLFVSTAPSISFMGRTQPSLIPSTELQFTFLQPFQGRYLISWCQNHLWVVDPIRMRVLGQTSALRNVRWTVGDEGDMYIFHDGYQIFRKVSLHSDYLLQAPALPPPALSAALAEGEVLQELNGGSQLDPGAGEPIDVSLLAAPDEKWPQSGDTRSSPIQEGAGVKSDIQSRLKEKLISDDILQKTKHFFKESVAPILEKTSTSFLRPPTPSKDTDAANTSNDSTADIEATSQCEENQADQPLAFASKSEQVRRLGTLQLMDSDELVVRKIKRKKRRRKKVGPSRASSLSSLITDTTSDLSEQPEIDLISQLAEDASKRQDPSKVSAEGAVEYKADPDDVVVAKDRLNKDEILKLRDSQLEEAGEVKFAFTYLSESSQAIQLRKSVPSEEMDSRSERDITSSHNSVFQLVPVQPVPDSPITNELDPGTTLSTESTDKCLHQQTESPEIDFNQIESDLKLSMTEIAFIALSTEGNSPKEGVTPLVAPDRSLVLSEDHFSPNGPTSNQPVEEEPDLESYDIIENAVNLRDSNLYNGHLLDSEDTPNPLYAEKLSRIINRRSRVFCFAPNELAKPGSAEENSKLLDSSNSQSEIVTSITMERDLQPTTPGSPSGNRWTAIRLPFTQSTQSMSVSDRAIWIVEGGKGSVYWCKTKATPISWQYVGGVSAQQVSTSYNGKIVLVVTKDHQLFTRDGISSGKCGGKTWLKLADGITCISCAPTTLWAISFTGDVQFSNNFDPDTFQTIASVVRFKQIDSSDSITVALGMDNIVYLRIGITADNMSGDAWKPVTKFEVSNVSVCLTTVWSISTEGRVYFNPELRNSRSVRSALDPTQAWFQVMLRTECPGLTRRSTGYIPRLPLVLTQTAQNVIWPNICRMPGSAKLSYVLPKPKRALTLEYESGHLISCSILDGVWVLSGNGSQRLYHCNTHIIGVKYLPLLEQDELGSPFISVSASYASGDQGMRSDHIWALKANGGLVCFDLNRKRSVIPPDRSMELRSVAACENCLWCCDLEHRCWVRTEINSKNPVGVKWVSPDLGNLEGEQILGISCGLLSMWAVSTKGEVWLRFGSSPMQHTFGRTLSPVWLRLSSDCGGESVLMKQVIVGPGDWKVWAISLDNCVYIRRGITGLFPIGDKWEQVPDMLAIELALSVYHVWVLDTNKELHIRIGVSQKNPSGNYWKPVLGAKLSKISVTPYGQLWSIDDRGELLCRLERNYLENDLVSSCVSVAAPKMSGWEIL